MSLRLRMLIYLPHHRFGIASTFQVFNLPVGASGALLRWVAIAQWGRRAQLGALQRWVATDDRHEPLERMQHRKTPALGLVILAASAMAHGFTIHHTARTTCALSASRTVRRRKKSAVRSALSTAGLRTDNLLQKPVWALCSIHNPRIILCAPIRVKYSLINTGSMAVRLRSTCRCLNALLSSFRAY